MRGGNGTANRIYFICQAVCGMQCQDHSRGRQCPILELAGVHSVDTVFTTLVFTWRHVVKIEIHYGWVMTKYISESEAPDSSLTFRIFMMMLSMVVPEVFVTLVKMLMVGKKEEECSVFVKLFLAASFLEMLILKSPRRMQSLFVLFICSMISSSLLLNVLRSESGITPTILFLPVIFCLDKKSDCDSKRDCRHGHAY